MTLSQLLNISEPMILSVKCGSLHATLRVGFPLGAPGDLSVLRPHPSPLQGFYDRIANPLLVDVELQYPKDTVSAVTQHSHKQHYAGSEIVVAGRIADNKQSSFKADVQAHGVNHGLRMMQKPDGTQRLQTHTVPQPASSRGPFFP